MSNVTIRMMYNCVQVSIYSVVEKLIYVTYAIVHQVICEWYHLYLYCCVFTVQYCRVITIVEHGTRKCHKFIVYKYKA